MLEGSAPFIFYQPQKEHPLIWEHNDFYINYLKNYKGAKLSEVNGTKLVTIDKDVWISNPNKANLLAVVHDYSDKGKREINFRSLDIKQAEELKTIELQQGLYSKIVPQTIDEIIYSISDLKALKTYNLRHAHKYLIATEELILEELNSNNVHKAEEVLSNWRETQGTKYLEDLRTKKDSFYLNSSLEFSNNAKSFLGCLNDQPVSVMTVGVCGGTASVILNKTLSGYKNHANTILGKRGVTEASYLLLCDHLEKNDIKWLNDGDSVPGSGAERRKLSWKPVHKISSYTLSVYIG